MHTARALLSPLFCLCFVLALGHTTRAGELSGFGVGAKISSLGVGGDVVASVADSLNLRLGLQGFTYDYDDTYSDIDYEADLDLFTGLLLTDWFPFGNNFRISAGVAANGNEVTVTGKPRNSTFNIGGVTYPSSQVGSLTGTIDFNSVAPYLGVGYGGSFADSDNWSFFLDIGVLFQGSPDVSYSANGPLASDPTFQARLEQERKELEDDLDEYEYYPVISMGLTWKF
ncbi:MAG: hypothetical protein Kow0089_24010 [Desulfobulbaceae bacterium]